MHFDSYEQRGLLGITYEQRLMYVPTEMRAVIHDVRSMEMDER